MPPRTRSSKNKYAQPCNACTPTLKNKGSKVKLTSIKVISDKITPRKRSIKNSPEASSDTNNNAKRRLINLKTTSSPKDKVKATNNVSNKITNKNFSYKGLEDKTSSNKDNNLDVYEFTYDPNEEPPPAKKKRKTTVKKRQAKPKTVVFKNNYEQNLSKALAALKNVIAKKPDMPRSAAVVENHKLNITSTENNVAQQNVEQNLPQINTQISVQKNTTNNEIASKPANVTNPTKEQMYNSMRVEDIAACFEGSTEDNNDINYSPVNSPQCPKTPEISHQQIVEKSVHNNDPLNLQGDMSFFDENPVASSSMIMSARDPQASPWRVEFGNLPIKWHVNTYVKPNMTPAVESSFINFEDNKKKHVYTNLIGEDDGALEVEQNQSNLKQTSIISFIRERVQKSAQKKAKTISVTPTKTNNLFDDLPKVDSASNKTPKKSEKPSDNNCKLNTDELNRGQNSTQDKENLNEITEKRKKKNKKTENDEDGTFFGFDETEDQENQTPAKVNPNVRALRPRSRAVLREINAISGPMRALPLAAKSKVTASSDAMNKVYEEMKSAADAPVVADKGTMRKASEVTSVDEIPCDNDENSQSVLLFEDIELVHHLKPTRKSYGKARKVAFREHSTSSESANLDREEPVSSGEGDDLADLTFTMPIIEPEKKAKKKTKKQKMSKKEKKALDEWAAGFNSMCKDIEEVPLIIE